MWASMLFVMLKHRNYFVHWMGFCPPGLMVLVKSIFSVADVSLCVSRLLSRVRLRPCEL